jgi:hydrogenase-4 component B
MTAFPVSLAVVVAASGAGGVLAALLPASRSPRVIAWCGGLAAAAATAAGVAALVDGTVVARRLWTIPGIGDVVLRQDPLGGVFLLVTGLVLAPAAVFAVTALPPLLARYSGRAFAVLHFALVPAVVWILVAGDVFSFFVAWEIMSIVSYLLVGFEQDRQENRRAAYLMLVMSEAGALAALLGLLLLAAHAGAQDFDSIRTAAGTLGGGARLAVVLLALFGFGVKSGLVPVNGWLPGAYAAAPAAFVPVLAGATLNLGLYGIFRVCADLLPATFEAPGLVMLSVGSLSALTGILYATTDNDLKTLLAHSSIENAGIVTVGIGAGLVFVASHLPALAAIAFVAALYHLVNHALFKTLLFVGAGAVERQAGTRDLDRLGGLVHRMPWTTLAVLVGVVSIAALPPSNGFISEWLTLQTLLRSAELPSVAVKVVFALCGAALALTAALAVTCFAKVFAMGFLGMPRSAEAEDTREATPSALAALGGLAALCIVLGVVPTYVIGVLDGAVAPVAGARAASVLVPPFFATGAGDGSLPPAFLTEFHELGAQVGQGLVPGRGLVVLHRGGPANPVVFAAAPTYLGLVLAAMLLVVFGLVWMAARRRRSVVRRECWDGGVRRLLPEMTYTATGFANPVRVIFHAVFRPTIVEDTRAAVAEHFRTAIRREVETVHIVDRLVVEPARTLMLAVAGQLARMHQGRLNAYVAYVLLSLLAVMAIFALR